MQTILGALMIGSNQPIGASAVVSGMDKRPTAEALHVGWYGLEGDQQADRRVHGGPDKALHHYPFEHYSVWNTELDGCDLLGSPGAFGENLSTVGLTEENVAIGDIFQIGSAVVEVSQARQPCWKLNLRFGRGDMAFRVQTTGRTGWYYRVIEEGTVAVGDKLLLLERRMPDWPLRRIWRSLYVDTLNRSELAAIAALSGLPENWRHLAKHRLATCRVEDWGPRLSGDTGGLPEG